MKRATVITSVAIAVFALSGCGPQNSAENPGASEPPLISHEAGDEHLEEFEPAEHAPPVWDDASRVSAVKRAAAAMAAFARPDLSAIEWLTQLTPFMTTELAQEMAYTDPAGIPPVVASGEPQIVDESSVYLARVEVPTDGGTYTVLLVRESADTPWLVTRFMLPEVG